VSTRQQHGGLNPVTLAAQLYEDGDWLRSRDGLPLEAAISARHPHRNLARCSAARRRCGAGDSGGVWTVTETFGCCLQARGGVRACAQPAALCLGARTAAATKRAKRLKRIPCAV
jgi:hypothetical protein